MLQAALKFSSHVHVVPTHKPAKKCMTNGSLIIDINFFKCQDLHQKQETGEHDWFPY